MTASRVARRRLLELVQALQPQINSSSIHTPVPHASADYAAAVAGNYTTSNRGSNGSGGNFETAGVSRESWGMYTNTAVDVAPSCGARVFKRRPNMQVFSHTVMHCCSA